MNFTRTPVWDLLRAKATALQRELAREVSLEDRVGEVRLIAGVDLAVGRFGELGRGAVVVWRLEDEAVVESITVELPLTIPYIPGLLAFREGPLVEAALRQVRSEPDVVMVDGHGISHPRGLGIAAHLGVLLDRPTIGVAKSPLYARGPDPGPDPGDRAALSTPRGEPIGYQLRTRTRSKPVYVSPGNHLTPETAVDLVWRCCRGHRLPEPTFLADRLSKTR
jgi:deoxyribonuclease V